MTTGPKDVPEPGGHPDLGLIAAHAERRLHGAEAAQRARFAIAVARSSSGVAPQARR